jgi:hypothetical protein
VRWLFVSGAAGLPMVASPRGLWLRVIARAVEAASAPAVLVDERLESLPADEARGILESPGLSPVPSTFTAFLAHTTLDLGRWSDSTCMELEATVASDLSAAILRGHARVPLR